MPPKSTQVRKASTRARKVPNRDPVSAIAQQRAPIPPAYNSTIPVVCNDAYDDYLPYSSPTSSNHSFSNVQVASGPSVMPESPTRSTPSQPIKPTVILDDLQQSINIEQVLTKERVFT